MLKGQAREDFEKWFSSYIDKQLAHNREDWNEGEELLSNFYELPFSMQYGVLVDWFDSVGIIVDVIKTDFNRLYNFEVYDENDIGKITNFLDGIETRPQARQKAIEQANKIYNDRK